MSTGEIDVLKIVHRSQSDKRLADRIKTILSLNEGLSYAEISRILLLDDDTIRHYYKTYSEQGIKGLLQLNYTGGLSYLSKEETEKLDVYLETNLHLTSKEVVRHIESEYEVMYTAEGVRALLGRLGFVFKKTKHLPGKGDVARQKEFVEQYNEIKAGKGKEDEIYFVDAVHFAQLNSKWGLDKERERESDKSQYRKKSTEYKWCLQCGYRRNDNPR